MKDPVTPGDYFDLSSFAHAKLFDGCGFVWEALGRIAPHLEVSLVPGLHHKGEGRFHVEGSVFIGEGTVIEEGAFIRGPAIIGRNCEIRHGAYIRGNVITGDDCVLGNSCEFKNCVLMNHVEVPHFSYVGDSILGNHAHLGAGVICSNLKLAPGHVVVRAEGKNYDTGLRKFGAIVGDHGQVGCNSVLNPGTLIGPSSIVYPGTQVRGIIPREVVYKTQVSVHTAPLKS